MLEGLVSFLSFIEVYVVPIVFAIGVIFFLYGGIQYFIFGAPSGDTEMIEHGRHNMLNASLLFALALLVYGIVAGLSWLATSFSAPSIETDRGGGGYGADIEREGSVLPVPNAPQGNE